ncbi:MAG: transcriptional activator NhaR [Planctomycetota bacterium]|nr:transcriptional activator NhaR [Planctomycetota bacterium]
MEWLNYHHLLYFWMVAREGSVARAGERLLLAQPTISAQWHKLEKSLGQKLFKKVGRNLALTEMGQTVYRYADEIFAIGRELQDVVKGSASGSPRRLHVGIADVVPKLIAYKLLEPALQQPDPTHLVCLEDKPDRLLAELAVQGLDLILCDSPAPPTVKVRSYNHLLGESGVSVFGTTELAARFKKGFPQSLHSAPFLLPSGNSAMRRSLDQWFNSRGIRPDLKAEFDDSALMKAFGQGGVGLFVGSTVIEPEICGQFGVEVVGRLDEIQERYYAITVERKLKHPAVVAISEAARNKLFQGPGGASSSAKAAR